MAQAETRAFEPYIPAERSLPVYALYVLYFPQLVAGPIERAQRLLPQLSRPRRVTAEALWSLADVAEAADASAGCPPS